MKSWHALKVEWLPAAGTPAISSPLIRDEGPLRASASVGWVGGLSVWCLCVRVCVCDVYGCMCVCLCVCVSVRHVGGMGAQAGRSPGSRCVPPAVCHRVACLLGLEGAIDNVSV